MNTRDQRDADFAAAAAEPPRDFDVRTAHTSELFILLDTENLTVCLFGTQGEHLPADRDEAKAEIKRVQLLVIDEIDRRFPIPGAPTAAGSLTTAEAARIKELLGLAWEEGFLKSPEDDELHAAINRATAHDAAAEDVGSPPPSPELDAGAELEQNDSTTETAR